VWAVSHISISGNYFQIYCIGSTAEPEKCLYNPLHDLSPSSIWLVHMPPPRPFLHLIPPSVSLPFSLQAPAIALKTYACTHDCVTPQNTRRINAYDGLLWSSILVPSLQSERLLFWIWHLHEYVPHDHLFRLQLVNPRSMAGSTALPPHEPRSSPEPFLFGLLSSHRAIDRCYLSLPQGLILVGVAITSSRVSDSDAEPTSEAPQPECGC